MPSTPETRLSLIRRLQSGTDAGAWDEFSSIYRPVIVRLAMSKGVQAADAEDLAQKVLLAVSKHIVRWKPDAGRGKFRTWLRKIVRNATLNTLSRIPGTPRRGGRRRCGRWPICPRAMPRRSISSGSAKP